jgi:hypothetical protein
MNEPRFDIFSGSLDKDAMWVEAVPGLAKARERMKELAAQVPGKYFVFSMHSHAVLASVDTSSNFNRAKSGTKAQGLA